jgi:hypothetical protein
MAKRAADADGLRTLKRKHVGAETDVVKVVESCWRDRAMGMSMLFRARACSLSELVELLLKQLMESPCPSPLLIDYLKESLMAFWPDQPESLDANIKQIISAFNPSQHFQFQAASEICEVSWIRTAVESMTFSSFSICFLSSRSRALTDPPETKTHTPETHALHISLKFHAILLLKDLCMGTHREGFSGFASILFHVFLFAPPSS